MSQLADLAKPFPKEWIKIKPGRGGAEYVEHSVITQRLLEVVGPFDFEVVKVVQQEGDTWCVLARLTCEVDGKWTTVVEGGQSDNKMDPFKSAISDALKRCAMRLGLGLHLWAQENYYLHNALPSSSPASPPGPDEDAGTPEPSPSAVPAPTSSEGEDGEAPPSEEPAFKLDPAERVRLRKGFMTKTKNDLGLDYDTQTKVWMTAKYGGGWSSLTDAQALALYRALMVPEGTRDEKEAAAERFKTAVLEHIEQENAA